MECWKDLKFTFRHYLNADVSAPVNYNEKNKKLNRRIQMFSELCREDINFNEFTDIITQLCLLPFNILKHQHLDHNQFLLQLRGKSWTLQLFSQLSFLLMDNPIEAYECSNTIHPLQYLMTRCLLVNGRTKKLRNWDLKFLSAFLLVTLEITKPCHISEPRHNLLKKWDPRQRIRHSDGSMIDDAIFDEFVFLCHHYINKAELFLSSNRLQIFKLFSEWTRDEAIKVLDNCHLFCYSCTMEENLKVKLRNGAYHPLTLVLKMLSDGHFTDINSFNRMIGSKNTNTFYLKALPMMIKMKDCDFPAVNKIDESISVGGYTGGTYVRRGECIIINQTFKNRFEYRRNGTEYDEFSLKRLWQSLGCHKITVKRDLTGTQIMKCLKVFSKQLKKSQPHYCVVIILSHGRRNLMTGLEEIMGVDMEGVSIKDIKEIFMNGKKCPAMIGKLKLFLFQACRGKTSPLPNPRRFCVDYLKEGLTHLKCLVYFLLLFGAFFWIYLVTKDSPPQYATHWMSDGTNSNLNSKQQNGVVDTENLVSKSIAKSVPDRSWYFVFHSTIDDFVSFRTNNGTFFIQSFCKEMSANCYRHDLNTIATYVNRSVMEKHKIQASVFENNLGDLVYFKPSVVKSQ